MLITNRKNEKNKNKRVIKVKKFVSLKLLMIQHYYDKLEWM